MEKKKVKGKEAKKDDIIILDKGINTKNEVNQTYLCCIILIFPYRAT
ncbi:MAG: hypothetical protein JW944_09305 [Deltaproteobacteria bacterium]|nr:hypothetical protein [Deltaproteobacteria bacterium]